MTRRDGRLRRDLTDAGIFLTLRRGEQLDLFEAVPGPVCIVRSPRAAAVASELAARTGAMRGLNSKTKGRCS